MTPSLPTLPVVTADSVNTSEPSVNKQQNLFESDSSSDFPQLLQEASGTPEAALTAEPEPEPGVQHLLEQLQSLPEDGKLLPLLQQTISLFARKELNVSFDGDLSKLKGYRFGLVRFSYGSTFDQAVKAGEITEVEYVSDMETNIRKFLRGRFDILICETGVAHHLLRRELGPEWRQQITQLSPAIETFHAYIGFSLANKLFTARDKVDDALRQMKHDGSYQQILRRYGLAPTKTQAVQ